VPWTLVYLAMVGLVLGALGFRTGGLEAAFGFSTVNYLYIALFCAASKDGLTDLFGADAADSWTLPVAATTALPLYAWMTLRAARKRGIARTAPGPAQGAAGSLPAPA
jgi:hypothetical protein